MEPTKEQRDVAAAILVSLIECLGHRPAGCSNCQAHIIPIASLLASREAKIAAEAFEKGWKDRDDGDGTDYQNPYADDRIKKEIEPER